MAFHAADEHRLGRARGAGDDVEHLMHAVAQVDVGPSARFVHDRRPRCAPAARMAGRVRFAAVGFCFRDPEPGHLLTEPPAKQLANQPGRGDIRRLRKEFRLKPPHFCIPALTFVRPGDPGLVVLCADLSLCAPSGFQYTASPWPAEAMSTTSPLSASHRSRDNGASSLPFARISVVVPSVPPVVASGL